MNLLLLSLGKPLLAASFFVGFASFRSSVSHEEAVQEAQQVRPPQELPRDDPPDPPKKPEPRKPEP